MASKKKTAPLPPGFGQRLRDRREELEIGTNELGRLIGVSGGAISRWESGERGSRIEVESIVKLEQVLGVTISYLWTGKRGETPAPPAAIEKLGEKMDRIERLLSTTTRAPDDETDVRHVKVTKS